MLRVAVALLLLAACGPGLKGVGTVEYRNSEVMLAAQDLAGASQAHDVAAVRKLVRGSIVNGGMWFGDLSCTVAFAAPGEIPAAKVDQFAECIAKLGLAKSDRGSMLPDVVVFQYGPGVEVEARFVEDDGPRISWIGYVGRRDTKDALPTVTAASLETLRTAPAPAVDGIPENGFAWLKVCLDATGAVTGVEVRQTSEPAVARKFAAAARTWQFRPFVIGTQPQPVCSLVLQGKPRESTKNVTLRPPYRALPLPLPAEPRDIVLLGPGGLGKRIAGEDFVLPDEATRTRLSEANTGKMLGMFAYCVDTTGRVNQTLIVRSTGVASYDQRLITAIQNWVFAPYLDEGKPVPACSWVTFIYEYGDGHPPGMMRFGHVH